MADAAARGARSEPGVDVYFRHATAAVAEDLLSADGFIFATPENLATMAGMMKDFFDRTYYAALGKLNARPYAVLICAGSDGEGAARQLTRIATGWRLKPVAAPLIICTHADSTEKILAPKTIRPEDLRRCEETGAVLAAGLALGIF